MTERVKFTQVSRVICPRTGIHYLDAIDENGQHWTGQMETGVEKWITWKEQWKKNNQQPFEIQMKKYRIKKETYNDITRYFPQEKYLYCWYNIFAFDVYFDGGYETLEEAQKQLCVYCKGTMVEYLDFDPVRDCK